MQVLDLPFDQYQRYRILQEVVEACRWKKPLHILDVGGLSSALQQFLPDDRVITAGFRDQGRLDVYTSGLALPFNEGSFDVVVSADVLEHIEEKDREQFLTEMLRISSELVLIAAPFEDTAVVQAEEILQSLINARYKESFPFLEEHRKNGLPKLEASAGLLRKQGLQVTVLPNGYLHRWLLAISTFFLLQWRFHDPVLNARANRFYNSNFYPLDNREPSYRKVIIGSRSKDVTHLSSILNPGKNDANPVQMMLHVQALNGILNLITEQWSERAFKSEITLKSLQTESWAGLKDYLQVNFNELEEKRIFVRSLLAKAEEQDNSIKDLANRISLLEDVVRSKEDHIRVQADVIAQKNETIGIYQKELENLKNSLTWRWTEPVRKMVDFVRPADDIPNAAANSDFVLTSRENSNSKHGPLRFSIRSLNGIPIARLDTMRRPVITVSHVAPSPPRAGNEYRMNRLLKWLNGRGFDVIPIICPLTDEALQKEDLSKLAREFPHFVFCDRNAQITTSLSGLEHLDGRNVQNFAGKSAVSQLEDVFCPDHLVELILHLESKFVHCVVLTHYVFMTRVFEQLKPTTYRILDTIDVFSTKADKILSFGLSDPSALTPQQEKTLLERADLILAIQPVEKAQIEALAPSKNVIEIGVDFPVVESQKNFPGHKILFVGSDNPLNKKGVEDFLKFAWPRILEEVPDAEFLIAGRICSAMKNFPERVRCLGIVESLDKLYQTSKLVINPVVAGTGLKIKTMQAISHLKHVVTFPNGADGIPSELQRWCHVTTDWYEFYKTITQMLQSSDVFSEELQDLSIIRQSMSPENVYAGLFRELEIFYEKSSTEVVNRE